MKQLWENIKDIKIYIWPSIRKCCYEVWEEFKQYFDEKYLNHKNNKIYLDMISFIKDELNRLLIINENISIDTTCTKCSDNFFSYRWWDEKERFVLWIKKATII